MNSTWYGKGCDWIKGLKRRSLCWLSWVGLPCNHPYPRKSKTVAVLSRYLGGALWGRCLQRTWRRLSHGTCCAPPPRKAAAGSPTIIKLAPPIFGGELTGKSRLQSSQESSSLHTAAFFYCLGWQKWYRLEQLFGDLINENNYCLFYSIEKPLTEFLSFSA